MGEVMYHVLHRRRIATMAGACNVLEHNLRKGVVFSEDELIPDYIDVDLMKFNVYQGCLSREDFCRQYQNKLDAAKLKRKVQRNASRVIETLISASHTFCENWKTDEVERAKLQHYLEDAVKYESDKHGDSIMSLTTHWDETTVHCHILSIPLVEYVDKSSNEPRLKFSASEFFGGKGDLIKMHTDFHEKVGKKYGLERGQYGSRTSHRELKDYKSWEKEQRQMLQEKETSLAVHEHTIHELKQATLETASKLELREQELRKREYQVDFYGKALKIKQDQFEKMVLKTKQDIPQIPEPPISLSRNKLKVWVDSVQENVTKAFRNIKSAYEILASKYSNALDEIQKLRSANKLLHEDNLKIRQDFLYKPLSEIQAHRESVSVRKKELDAHRKEGGRDDHAKSR